MAVDMAAVVEATEAVAAMEVAEDSIMEVRFVT